MTTGRSIRRIHPSAKRGLSLVEAAVSTVLVGVLLVAALGTVGASRSGQQKVSFRRQGHLLAQSLMAEILQQAYEDADFDHSHQLHDFGGGGPPAPPEPAEAPTLGPEPDEADGTRAAFDDVDDYDGWSASPPSNRDGTSIPDTVGWQRSVRVTLLNPVTGQKDVTVDRGAKRITVTVTHDNAPVAELVAIRTVGLPPPQEGPTVLFVVTDDEGLTDQELARQALMQSWGFAVTLIEASEPLGVFTAAVADADVAYVPVQIDALDLGTKLRETPIGVVIEEMMNDFGIATDWQGMSREEIRIIDNSHYITSPFSTGLLTYLSSLQPVTKLNSGFAPSLNTLAEMFNTGSIWKPALAVIEIGGELAGGGTAAGRRVQLPWGADDFDFSALNADGLTIMKRAIEWAAGMEEGGATCGDGTCDAGEDSCDCPDDCGAPPSFEEPGLTCDDGTDNDCDGQTDCDDINCFADPACS